MHHVPVSMIARSPEDAHGALPIAYAGGSAIGLSATDAYGQSLSR
jgi:hypothetical protein